MAHLSPRQATTAHHLAHRLVTSCMQMHSASVHYDVCAELVHSLAQHMLAAAGPQHEFSAFFDQLPTEPAAHAAQHEQTHQVQQKPHTQQAEQTLGLGVMLQSIGSSSLPHMSTGHCVHAFDNAMHMPCHLSSLTPLQSYPVELSLSDMDTGENPFATSSGLTTAPSLGTGQDLENNQTQLVPMHAPQRFSTSNTPTTETHAAPVATEYKRTAGVPVATAPVAAQHHAQQPPEYQQMHRSATDIMCRGHDMDMLVDVADRYACIVLFILRHRLTNHICWDCLMHISYRNVSRE